MRTQQEILERVKLMKETGDDFLGFQTDNLIAALNYENAKPYLKENTSKKSWQLKKIKDYKKYMIEYMDFAWEKAINCRGLSAGRTLEHYKAWLWLDGDNELYLDILDDYEYYGKLELRKICKYLGINPDNYDDGIRVNRESELKSPTNYMPDGYEVIKITPQSTDKEKKKTDEPETLCVEWLSGCQQFSFMKDIREIINKIRFSDKNKLTHDEIYDDLKPIVAAVAVKYSNDNSFSVFIGIAMGKDEKADISYIKSMGQRTTEGIARGIFPQFSDMKYRS